MATIKKENWLGYETTNFFVSIVPKLIAFKLSFEQAVNFANKFRTLEELSEAYGYENALQTEEEYEGYLVVFSKGKLRVGWLDKGCITQSQPENNCHCPYNGSETAWREGKIFHLDGADNNKNARFHEAVIIRDLQIAGELNEYRNWRDPDGDAEEVDRQIKDKLVHSLLTGENVNLTENEDYFLSERFFYEYRRLFGNE